MKQISRLLVFSCLHFFLYSLHADQKGSDTVVSIQDHALFSGTIDNSMLTFGYFKNGFSFADNATTCTFNSVYPVSGKVSLNAGSLYLKSNLFFENDVDFETGGNFFANNHYIDLCATITGFNNIKQTRFDHANIYLNGDLTISGTVKFTGDCVLDGRWNTLTLDHGSLVISPNSTLTLRNIEMYGILDDNIRCADHSAKLVLDNMRWVERGDYTFSVGSFEIYNEVNFVGPYTFKYDSPLTSTIMQDSTWYLSDIVRLELGRNRSAWDREPLYFTDKSSALRMENCTVSITPSGVRLTTGTLIMDREVKFDVQSTTTIGSLVFGNGNPDDDVAWILYPKAVANLTGGCFLHEIVKQENFTTNAVEVKYVLSRGGVYWAKEDITFKNVGIYCYNYGTLWADEGVGVYFENCTMETEPVSYIFTGTFLGIYDNLLDGNGLIDVIRGEYPTTSWVKKTGNYIGGSGDITGSIILEHSGTELSLGLDAILRSNIILNGGKLELEKNLKICRDITLSGSGKIHMHGCDVHVACHDIAWTSTIIWNARKGALVLDEDFYLASEFSFSGDCVINGDGNHFFLENTGSLVIQKNSSLELKNIILDGVTLSKLRCLDNTGSIILDNAKIVLTGNYTFTQGSFLISGDSDFNGSCTFFYESPMTTTIQSQATLSFLNSIYLSMGRYSAMNNKEPLYFEDKTANIKFDGTNLIVTPSGMCLTRGTIQFFRDVVIDLSSTNSMHGFSLGNSNADDDIHFLWNSGTTVKFPRGHLVYANKVENPFETTANNALLILGEPLNIWINEDLRLMRVGVEYLGIGCNLWPAFGKTVYNNNVDFYWGGDSWRVKGTSTDMLSSILSGNDEIVVTGGALYLPTMVYGTGNIMQGLGVIATPIYLMEPDAELSFAMLSTIATDISSQGGTITAQLPIILGDNNTITGEATINVGYNSVSIGGQNLSWTSTVTWVGNNGLLTLRGNCALSSQWTFSGSGVLWGMGNTINLNRKGEIIVNRGSTLILRDVILDGISENRIKCLDNAGRIIFENVTWIQDHNATFDKGSIDIKEKLDMFGDGYTFSYCSPCVTTVLHRSHLILNEGFKFSYSPSSNANNLIHLTEHLSYIDMDSSSLHATTTGLQLTTGELRIWGHCTFESDARIRSEGFILGDGINEKNDLDIDIDTKAKLNLASGFLTYRNIGEADD